MNAQTNQPPAAGEACGTPGGYFSPTSPGGPGDVETEAEACLLRPYIPVSTILAINALSKEECAEADKRSQRFYDLAARKNAIKAQMAGLRRELKKLKQQTDEYFRQPLFARTNAARAAAWRAARQAREDAISRGELPRFETAGETSARAGLAQAKGQS